MSKGKILIVEDDAVFAENLSLSLTKLGFEIIGTVASGEEAIRRAETERPSLVLMDILLGGNIDGIAAADEIYHRHKIPVIYLTAYSDENTLRRTRGSGSFGYILKPFDEKELNASIEAALNRLRAEGPR